MKEVEIIASVALALFLYAYLNQEGFAVAQPRRKVYIPYGGGSVPPDKLTLGCGDYVYLSYAAAVQDAKWRAVFYADIAANRVVQDRDVPKLGQLRTRKVFKRLVVGAN